MMNEMALWYLKKNIHGCKQDQNPTGRFIAMEEHVGGYMSR